ncbi:hypothetical protein PT974_00967 [Cladobotryum mycophilum]|uniref:Heterokaryon incompatibility domain-containing protein n=1 Tax=Cladobotryum mycophilum TaxID=491253 RepID=A0ABR0T3M5_9HYPO
MEGKRELSSPQISHQSPGQKILRYNLSKLAQAQINLSATATPERYRLINCVNYISHYALSIHEFTDIKLVSYIAISYIWKGNISSPDESDEARNMTFTVVGGEDGDPVSISVLHDACKVALLEGIEWLWLDCLCIIQTDCTDKSWQIKHMYDIYRYYRISVVLPGGLSRLVPIDEETKWITRAWTLQEAEWEGGIQGEVGEVSCGVSAIVLLHQLLKACHYSQALTWTPDDGSGERDDLSPCVLGDYGNAGVGAPLWALAATDPEERAMALWQSSMLRASSRPVDMVFSIMGFFGVTVEPRQFDSQDRIGATIALAQGIPRKGGKPVWLGLSLDIRPSPFLSSFADFPVTDVTGNVRWAQRRGPLQPNVSDSIYDIEWLNEEIDDGTESQAEDVASVSLPQYWLTDLPPATMDNDGYLIISSKAARIVPTGQIFGRRRTNLMKNNDYITLELADAAPDNVTRVVGTDGRVWDIIPDSTGPGVPSNDVELDPVTAYMVVVGVSKKFPLDPVYQPDPRPVGGILLDEMSTIRACAVEEHRPGKFHRSSTFLLEAGRFQNILDQWPVISISIGRPEEYESKN